MDDEGLRRDLSQRGLQRCLEKYSATALAAQTFEAFRRLVGGGMTFSGGALGAGRYLGMLDR
jgi:hypothetical protein